MVVERDCSDKEFQEALELQRAKPDATWYKLPLKGFDYGPTPTQPTVPTIDPTFLPVPEDGTLSFDEPMKMQFASGAGGWDTVITLHPDGSFEGDFHDMDMGVTGPGYQSTEYVCQFHGRFGEIRQITGASWSLTLEELTLDTGHPIGEEWIEANPANRNYNLRYISSTPYGFDRWDDEPLEPGVQFHICEEGSPFSPSRQDGVHRHPDYQMQTPCHTHSSPLMSDTSRVIGSIKMIFRRLLSA